MTCSPSGELSILGEWVLFLARFLLNLPTARDGRWQTYDFRFEDDSVTITPAAEAFTLAGLSFLSSSKGEDAVSILALSSSHVLLAGVSDAPNPDIIILLWDLKYSVVLASQSLPIPSTLTQSKDLSLNLNLAAASASQALLVLSSATPRKAQASSQQSSVLVVPFVAPEISTIANAIGKAADSAKWIKSSPESPAFGRVSHDPGRTQVLETMKAAIEQHKPQAANEAFFEWEKEISVTTNGDAPSKGKEASFPTEG